MKKYRFLFAALVSLVMIPLQVNSQNYNANYDESKIPSYELPDPLIFNNGKQVINAAQWMQQRRAEILEIFAQEMYGHIPAFPEGLHFEVINKEFVYDGLGIRKIIRIFLDQSESHWFDVLMHVPNNTNRPVPMFVGLNFKSNEATLDERASSRWPYELILKAGFGVATAWRDAIEPDGKDSKINESNTVCKDGGVRSWYNKNGDWGAISAWAWGLSRIYDYLLTDPDVDTSKVAVIGHSRLGKTALWAGANDTRFAMVISNCSGCCGAALSRRVIGENFSIISTAFPHWFTREFDKYKNREADFPADQHWLLSLVAPRPLYVASATEDLWADPKGEWISAFEVAPVYKLFNKEGLHETYPNPDSPDNSRTVAYHVRTGKHDITAYDWSQYIEFAKRMFH